MRTLLCTLVLILSTSLLAAAADPTAIIHTTAGDLHCTLLPKVAPIGVENFIGLANGTKDWTSPISHEKKHGVPLYDGTIFHRVIPQFMIQGGDPAGNGTGDPGYKFKNETSIRRHLRSPRASCLCECRTRHQRVAVLHHGNSVSQPEWRLHNFWPV